jgi:hypothetical protein
MGRYRLISPAEDLFLATASDTTCKQGDQMGLRKKIGQKEAQPSFLLK